MYRSFHRSSTHNCPFNRLPMDFYWVKKSVRFSTEKKTFKNLRLKIILFRKNILFKNEPSEVWRSILRMLLNGFILRNRSLSSISKRSQVYCSHRTFHRSSTYKCPFYGLPMTVSLSLGKKKLLHRFLTDKKKVSESSIKKNIFHKKGIL